MTWSRCRLLVAVTVLGLGVTRARAIRPTSSELETVRAWTDAMLAPTALSPPFSFVYGGRVSGELLPAWVASSMTRRLGRHRTQQTLTWRDPATGLVVRCVAIHYRDSPTVEWTLHFENTGAADTPILEAIHALDIHLERGANAEFLLHHNVGSVASRWDYAPLETPLVPSTVEHFSATGGRPSSIDLPYFDLAWGGQGMILAVGWPGQWTAEFARDDGRGIRIRAGQELTHFRLHPGEAARSPLVVLEAWKGDWLRGQNLWRRWMLIHNVPRPGGRLLRPYMLANSSRAYDEMLGADEANQILHIDRYLEEGLKIDYWWMDAGWYVEQSGWWQTGTWEIDPIRFPNGFRPIADYAHGRGVKIVLWFEPERVVAGTWLADTHPEWVLGGRSGGLLDLGNPEAWRWLVDHIDQLLTDNAIDVYRQDLNIDPLPFWKGHDAPDRVGITEIRHVTGYLAFWDELQRRHPDLLIDSCASGGRRNDLESLRRAVPLWRSDYVYEPIGTQGMTYGLSAWFPYYGSGTVATSDASYYGAGWTPVEKYAFWSNAAPALTWGIDVRVTDLDYAALRKLFDHWRRISHLYSGDYYPLTSYSQDDDAWLAWQFDHPTHGDGMVQVFRRATCSDDSIRLRLHGLDRTALYTIRDMESRTTRRMRGGRLMRTGVQVTVSERPGTVVLLYQKAQPGDASPAPVPGRR